MMEIAAQRDIAVQMGCEPDWKAIAARAILAMSPCSPYADSLAAYVKLQAPELLKELSLFYKSFGCPSSGPARALGSEYWAKLVNLNFGVGLKCPRIMLALVEVNLIAPANKLIEGVCKLLTPASLQQLTTKEIRSQVLACEVLMTDARKLVDCFDLSTAQRVRLVGKLDCRLACWLTKRGKDM